MNQEEVTPKNIVLIGFMGCGKSTVGRELNKRLGYPLTDMDQLIEETMGKRITEIFKEGVESAFRDFETLQLLEISKQTETRHIISTGGGIVVRPGNRPLLKQLGYVVWLDTPQEEIYRRTSRNNDRPLLNQPDARERIATMMAEREPWYRETAHLKIDTGGLESHEIAAGILESARYFFTQPV